MDWRDILKQYLFDHKRPKGALPPHPSVMYIDRTEELTPQQVKDFLDEIACITADRRES